MLKYLRYALIFLVFASVMLPLGVVGAQAKTLVWLRWDADIAVQPNGDLRVVETQVISFNSGTFREGFREIPQQFTEGIVDVKVYELDPNSNFRFELESFASQRGDFENTLDIVWFFEPVSNAVRTYQLEYTVRGALRIYESDAVEFCAGGGPSCDILSWNAVPPDHAFPVQDSTVTVRLPAGAEILREPEVISAASVFWRTDDDNLGVQFESAEALNNGEGINIRVTFAHGAVAAEPPVWQQAVDWEIAYGERVKPIVNVAVLVLSVLLVMGALLGVYLIWFLRGRDPKAGPAPEFLTEPPSDLRPGVVGTLLDERVDMRDITATLIDLARRGYAILEERQKAGAYGSKSRRFVFRKTTESLEGVNEYESTLFQAFFGRKDERSVSKSLPRGFYNKLPKVKEQLYEEATTSGLFKKAPDHVRAAYLGWGFAGLFVAAVVFFVGGALLSSLTDFAVCPAFGIGLFAVGLMIFSRAMPVKTRKGAEEAAKWWAFRKYLQRIEQYADVEAAAKQFDRYLPYAVALNVDRRWVNAFSKVESVPAPGWYRPYYVGGLPHQPAAGTSAGRLAKPAAAGPGGGVVGGLNTLGEGAITGLNQMADGLVSALNTTGRTFSTPPASSYRGGGSSGWSGGFSGGGFSGGGGGFSGGGGGGGFR